MPFLNKISAKRRRIKTWMRDIKKARASRRINFFLKRSRGVIHIGASSGQERDLYAEHDLKVLWLEPIPDVFDQLTENIRSYAEQRALQALLLDQDDVEVALHIASNSGKSSSVLPMKDHKRMWPHVHYDGQLSMRSITLDTLIQREGIDGRSYDTIVMDTQGSELRVLMGARSTLQGITYVKVEAADFESYEGGCTAEDLSAFFGEAGFVEERRQCFSSMPGVGSYYDLVFRRLEKAQQPT